MGTAGSRGPDVFVVGAAKSGTTALWYLLGQHPDIFMSPVKEPHRYATDLQLGQDAFVARHPELFLPSHPVDFWSAHMTAIGPGLGADEDSYRRLFAGVTTESAVGEASPSYLLSRTAAGEIAARHPQARILIVLRHPVDLMHSLHAMIRLGAHEPHQRFADAVTAARRRPWPDPPDNRVWARYFDVVDFVPQVGRFLDAFPREQVHITLLDDVRRDVVAWIHGVHRFLDVRPTTPPDLRPANDSKIVWSGRLHRLLLDPPGRMRAVMNRVPEPAKVALVKANMKAVPRPPLDPALRAQLAAELAPGIEALGELIGRDLTHWLE